MTQDMPDEIWATRETIAPGFNLNGWSPFNNGGTKYIRVYLAPRATTGESVEALKREVLGADNRTSPLTFAEKEHWSKCLDHIASLYTLTPITKGKPDDR